MHLRPRISVDGVPFSIVPPELLGLRGRPAREAHSGVGLHEFDYGDVVYRFQASGRLEEVTLQAPVLHLGTLAVPFAALAAFLRGSDAGAFDRAGFIVSPAFGLAFDPGDPNWVTTLAAHAIAEWRAL